MILIIFNKGPEYINIKLHFPFKRSKQGQVTKQQMPKYTKEEKRTYTLEELKRYKQSLNVNRSILTTPTKSDKGRSPSN